MAQTQETQVLSRPAGQRTFGAVMVHAQPDGRSTHRVKMAALLARDFDATLIGVGAEIFEPVATVDPYGMAPVGEWMAAAQQQVSADLKAAEKVFAHDAAGARTEWRCTEDYPARAIATLCRAADLIVAGGGVNKAGQKSTAAAVADLAMSSGRPVLVVPAQGHALKAETIVVAWKDTRESRRAVSDAMPFLMRARDVLVVAVCPKETEALTRDSVRDVVEHLTRSGVKARSTVVVEPDDLTAEEVRSVATAAGADLIVAGAYGHSRFREWALGGVTRDLLRDPTHYLLLSH
jgi:nucleotide-binding universal stress UspA family protein